MSKYRALLIGNGLYEKDPYLRDIKGPTNDVMALSDALTHPEYGLWALEPPLVDCDHTEIGQAWRSVPMVLGACST